MNDQERLARARSVAVTSGRSQEHLRFVIAYLEKREAELLRQVEDAERNSEFLTAHNGVRQIAALEEERARIKAENAELRRVVNLAIEWGTAIHNLEQARKKPEDGERKKGGESVYKANQAYTKAHLALKAGLRSVILPE